ncbi:hypothetical protein [Thalassobacillus hwangdonensis]|uniref:DUF4367 domain-containing protein n=1 Tax=Thalassobacillus hwangdonensis TaxID=546108 RepID=A0ABW3KVN1_9BACI
MKHRFLLFMCLLTLLLLTACQTTYAVPQGYYTYDDQELSSSLDELSYEPELPKFIPVQSIAVVSDHYMEEDAEKLDISFFTENNDLLSIQITQGSSEQGFLNEEEVEISSSLTGSYIDNAFARTLSWTKDGIKYSLSYRESVHSQDDRPPQVTKEDLMEVARSFRM